MNDPVAVCAMEHVAEMLALRVSTSRQLGADPELVLYGGGNTSLKADWHAPGLATHACLYVKGSGTDLAQVTEADFTPLALAPVRALLDGPPLGNEALMAAIEPHKLDPAAPRPSIETLLHAGLPHACVDHTHADAVLALVNTVNGAALAQEVFGDLAPLVPFQRSGFALAKTCQTVWQRRATPRTIGLILHQHGAVSMGEDAAQSRLHMLRLADLARRHLEAHRAWALPRATPAPRGPEGALALARLRGELSAAAGFPLLLAVDNSPEAMGFAHRPDVAHLSAGPATAQHAVFTKGRALCDGDVGAWSRAYRALLAAHTPSGWPAATLPDAAPRIVVDRRFGIAAASVDAAHAAMSARVFQHGFAIASRAAAHDRFLPMDPVEALLAELYYGGFEHALRERARRDAPLTGAVVVLEPERSPAAALLEHLGAAVVVAAGAQPEALERAVTEACWRHGGADALVSPAAPAAHCRQVLDASPLAAAWFDTAGAGAAHGRYEPVRGLSAERLAAALARRLGLALAAAA